MERITDWMIYLGVGLGLVYIISQSVIFSFLRVRIARLNPLFEALLYCPSCTGFWVGLMLGALGIYPRLPNCFEPILDDVWFAGAVISGLLVMIVANGWWGWLYQGSNPAYAAEEPLLRRSVRGRASQKET